MRHFSKHLSTEILEDIRLYIDSFDNSEDSFSAIEIRIDASDASFKELPQCKRKRKEYSVTRAKSVPKKLFNEVNIDIPEKKPSFCEKLFAIIDEKGLKDSSVYKKADIDRRLFSKIRSDADYHPSKSTAIRLCLALELDIINTERLLESAGYCLSLSDTADLVIRYCIEHKIFDTISVNEAIDYFSAKTI